MSSSLFEIASNLTKTTDKVSLYATVPLLVVLVIGNLVNLRVFSSRSFKNTSISFYLRVLAIVDILDCYSLICYFARYFDLQFQRTSDLMCRLDSYFFNTFTLYSPWISAIVAVDRLF